MNPYEFARCFLQPYKIKGLEIVPQYCPYCHGGKNKDKYTFALNIEKLTYNCKRGSCGKTGTFKALCKDFGVELSTEIYERKSRCVMAEYKTPQTKIKQASSKVEQYLAKRGISRKTWERRQVSEHNGNIVFPYYENGQLVMLKFRPARKVKPGERKGWREKGGKPVLWGMDLCEPDKPLVICEGECDALALDEAGIKNVVSVPSGAEDLTFIELCWDFLEQFDRVIIWVDNDEPGRKLQENLIKKLGAWKCSTVTSTRKDANEVLYHDGPAEVRMLFDSAKPVPIEGLCDLSEVENFDLSKETRVRSSIQKLNRILGGYFLGNITIWTGINSSGKSTLLGQECLEAINQGYKVCGFSGELPKRIFKYWIDLQAAGPMHIEKRYDTIKEADVYYPTNEAARKITNWYKGKFFLYDSFGGARDRDMFRVFEYAAKRYDCKFFFVDNLATTVFGDNNDDFYRRQSQFISNCADFAHTHNCHFHIVAHPRKTEGRIGKMDIKGSGGITDRADNVIAVHRCTPEEHQEYGAPNLIDIFKNRLFGEQLVTVPVQFNPHCKRFYHADEGIKNFTWDHMSKEEVREMFENA